jgi:glycine/D-amino acid oxidase-like deaminating enzyme
MTNPNQTLAVPHATSDVAATWSRMPPPPARVPERADVVIIGGGIVGVSCAWFLARKGLDVVLCEKGCVAGEQSGRNWGWVRIQGRDTREMPMMLESLKIWQRLKDELGEDVGFTRGGCVFAATSDKQMRQLGQWLTVADEFGIDTRLLDVHEVERIVPNTAANWRGALYTASDGRAEPQLATPAMARAVARCGGQVLQNCAVRGLETMGGAVSAVVTEHGTIKTSTVLCAAGAWTSMFCRSLGVNVPQLRVKGTVVRIAPTRSILEGNVFDDRLGIRRRQDGGYTVAHGSILEHPITPSSFRYFFKFLPALLQEHSTLRLTIGREFRDEFFQTKQWPLDTVSPFEETRVLNPQPTASIVRGIRKNIDRNYPRLRGVPIIESWAGVVESSPDVVPIIDQIESLPGFHVATGFSGHGFGLGPGAGKAIAGLLTGDDSGIDTAAFKLSRFFDGSPIRPQVTI